MKFWSPGFACSQSMPQDFTRAGANLSPALCWEQLPEKTVSLALLCTDRDASRLWYHWVLWNLNPAWQKLPQNLPRRREYQGLRQGMNSYHTLGYDGPQPPRGEEHRYLFRLYALDRKLRLSPGAPGPQLQLAMEGKVLAKAHFIGLSAN